ncbi:preprotein translocase subunit SecA [Mesoplasma syrphidae]|uniref:Protein translocase subunit SecA n=1 Tax=Mesoplasma syrphidae TaxID=225999 RepID=A0A2K9BP79_9MOLU|nr:preprotein translocase subunit SecA [Mesoplasma syrphidae]AUF83843.1 preprotein translocase subunit SecA [Mesoplasma syrphidae]
MASDKKLIKYYGKIADQIIKLESKYAKLKDEDFKDVTAEFKQRLSNGEELDDILVEAYAAAREAAFRVLGLKAYRVQLIGAIILNVGDIAEMRTGEGKTLTGLFPAYLNSLTGKGVHIVTVNEYLSRRDSEINGKVYDILGVTVGLNSSEIHKGAKREAYLKDITYTTNSELGFDYLKDNMVTDYAQKVQRGLNYAIIDEADSILIDESRTPLIISGGTSSRVNLYKHADAFAKTLKNPTDVDIDLESKQVYLNEQGMKKAKEYFTLENLFALENTEIFHLIMNALKAHFTFKEGVEYTVRDNEIVLIDQFTGRIMDGRAYSDGLQQALQAKEGVEIEEETITMATITYQNFYRLYAKIAGMTGTAKTEEEEFIKIYNTRVVVTPTNRPVIRKDEPDYTFGTKNAALKKMIADAKIINEKGNPILIGTTSVESSEQIARYLEKADLKFEMINAKNHHREADIIAMAGQKGAITLATNMAGRGTDIKLSEVVKELGGLVVFGVERNEARRIDNQLRGRAGRQGDPGMSRYYISMDDELMIRFSSPKMRANFAKLGDEHIKSKFFTRAVTNAQKKLEGMNFDQRKNVLDYDNILAQQREAMYAQRDDILQAESLKVVLKKFQITVAYDLIEEFNILVHGERTIDAKKLFKALDGKLVAHNKFKETDFFNKEKMELAEQIAQAMMEFYSIRVADVPENVILDMERRTILESFDRFWTKHIDLSSKLKSGIYLQQYAQNNPLAEYVEQATTLFNKMKINIASEVINKLSNVVLKAVENEETPLPIEITDNDIEDIFAETGLDKSMVNNEAINKRFDELEAKNQENIQVLHKLKIQRDIMLGLVIEIEKRFGNNKPQQIEIEAEAIEAMLKIFGITNPEDMKVEIIEEKYQQLLREAENEEQEQLQLKMAKEILNDFILKNELFKIKKPTRVDENDDGLTKVTKTRIG